MDAFATVADYAARCGPVEDVDEGRVDALLEDASAYLRGAYRRHMGTRYLAGANQTFDENVKAVCVAMVARAVNAPGAMAGITQQSQTAGPYSSSFTFANPTGDLYLGRSDLKRLGLAGCRVRSIQAMTAADREGDADV